MAGLQEGQLSCKKTNSTNPKRFYSTTGAEEMGHSLVNSTQWETCCSRGKTATEVVVNIEAIMRSHDQLSSYLI